MTRLQGHLTGALIAILGLAATLGAQSPPDFSAVAPKMQEFVDRGEASGVVTLVAGKDEVLHLAATGYSDLSSKRRMRADDIFWIASMSKPITGACIGILVDDGKLRFDDAVAKYLPEFAAQVVAENGQTGPPAHPITLREVLSHTSGLPEVSRRDSHLTLEETSKLIAAAPLRFQPGSAWSYSTAGIDAMGRIVEVVSGMPFDRFLQTRLFEPLGMTQTTFWVDTSQKDRWARSYRWVAQESRLEETTISFMYGTDVTDRARPPLGGAGLFSTADDIARFYQMMLNGGQLRGRRILTARTVSELTRKQTGDLRARPGMPWGLGFSRVEDPQGMEANNVLSPGSFGHGGAYSTQSWADPVRNLIWVVMFQRTGKGNPDNSDVRIAFQNAVKMK